MKLLKWQKEYKLKIKKMDDFDLLNEIIDTISDEFGDSRDYWMSDKAIEELKNRLKKYNKIKEII